MALPHWFSLVIESSIYWLELWLFKCLYSAALNLCNFALCVALIKCQIEQCFRYEMWLQQSHKKEEICMQSGKNFHVRFLNDTDHDLCEGHSRLSSKFSGYLNLSVLGTFHLFLQIYSTFFFTWFVLRLTIMNCFNWPPCLWLPLVQLNGISGKKDNPLPLWRTVEGSCVL